MNGSYTYLKGRLQPEINIFMVAVGPTMVVITLMLLIKPVGGHRQNRPSDGLNFTFIYNVCLLLAAYLMGIMIVEDIVDLNHIVITLFTILLFVLLLLPIVIPILLSFSLEQRPAEESLLPVPQKEEPSKSGHDVNEVIFSELEDEKPAEVDLLPESERHRRIAQLQAKLCQAAAEGAVRVKRRKGPRRGEDFTLMQALIKADFWLIFFSLLLGSGSGLTVIDNLGQMSQSLGYDNTHVFVSMISIWNFLGHVRSFVSSLNKYLLKHKLMAGGDRFLRDPIIEGSNSRFWDGTLFLV
ncbi:uncharacterized protein LOC122076396 [Macadamia integrifolia]|uniref:uncharacterized protein LOC122076396 n=1 Tax=Macadamia integrifolia TaxID=60698 RepID=UPI001C4F404F|nr:uncharacterized protein LOC122076396 [Macadamia integrifolia]